MYLTTIYDEKLIKEIIIMTFPLNLFLFLQQSVVFYCFAPNLTDEPDISALL